MKNIIVMVLIVLFIVAGIVAYVVYDNHRAQIPPNDPFLSGNSGGNLLNDGLFCEDGALVYFANSYDGGQLYVMNSDESQVRKLNSFNVSHINVGGDFLYFTQSPSGTGDSFMGLSAGIPGLYRSRTNGQDVSHFNTGPVLAATLCGNEIYYLGVDDAQREYITRLYKINTDITDKREVSRDIIWPHSYANGVIYYSSAGSNDHYIYALDVASGSSYVVLEANTFNTIYDGGYLYYMDLDNNYQLCRFSPTANTMEVLTNDRVEAYNVGYGVIFYQRYSRTEPVLMRMDANGDNPVFVREGNYTKINLTSRYAYFQAFGDTVTTHKAPLHGPPHIEHFTAAYDAVE